MYWPMPREATKAAGKEGEMEATPRGNPYPVIISSGNRRQSLYSKGRADSENHELRRPGRPRPGGRAKLAFSARFLECSARLNMRSCTPPDGRGCPSLGGRVRALMQEIGTVKGIALGRFESRVADNPAQFFFRGAIGYAGGAHDIFFQHHRSYVVAAEAQAHLAD